MFIYLASAIDKNKDEKRANVDKLIKRIEKAWPTGDASLVIFNPSAAFLGTVTRITQKEIGHIEGINHDALFRSDALLLYYQPGVETWGVPIELDQYSICNRPIFVFIEDPSVQWGDLPLYMRRRLRIDRVFHIPENLTNALAEYA